MIIIDSDIIGTDLSGTKVSRYQGQGLKAFLA